MTDTQEKFKLLLSKDDSLNRLLIKKEVGLFSDFSRTSYDEDLKVYIKDMYYNTFKELYHKHDEAGEQAIVNALLRSVEYLATKETKALIVVDLQVNLEEAHKNISKIKDSLSSKGGLMLYGALLDKSFNHVNLNILNTFDGYDNIKVLKNMIINTSLDICDLVSKANTDEEFHAFELHNVLIEKLDKIKDLDLSKKRFDKHSRKKSVKNAGLMFRFWIWVIFIAAIFIIRVIIKML